MIRPLIDLLLYGHFWIALAAFSFYAQSRLLLSGKPPDTLLGPFLAAGTLCLYAIHRLVGMQKIGRAGAESRYQTIYRFRYHIWVYAISAGFMGSLLFWWLPSRVQWLFIGPAVLSALYVIPMHRGKRLRDLPYIKIFTIALVWPWLTVLLPAAELHLLGTLPPWLLALERGCFVFALALTFDIRDFRIDERTHVKTLATLLGEGGTKRLAYVALLTALLIGYLCYCVFIYSFPQFLALSLSLALAGFATKWSSDRRSDYYYTGLIDGLMILQFCLFWLASLW